MLAILFLLSLVTVSITFEPVHAALTWNDQMLKEYVWAGGWCPIVVDQNNTVHIAYLDGYTLTYARYDGSVWTNQTIASDGIYFIFSLVLDANDYPHLLYEKKWEGPLMLANWNGKTWDSQNTGISYADYATLTLDSHGNPNIAYPTYTTVINDHNDYSKNSVNTALNYARWTGTGWNTQIVDSIVNGSFSPISIAVNKNNTPYVLYSPSSDSSIIKLATVQNSNWKIQAAQLPSSTGNCGNIVMDSEGHPHFLYTQSYQNSSTVSSIMYASYDLTSWTTQTAVSEVNLGTIGQLVLDSNDNPHFTIGTSAGDTMYAAYSGNTWKIQKLPSDLEVGNLALDSNGNPHLLFRAYSPARYSSELMYATATGTMDTTSSTETASNLNLTTFETSILIALAGLVTVVAAASIYNWKKKTR